MSFMSRVDRRLRMSACLLATSVCLNCHSESASLAPPPPNLILRVSPSLAGSFVGQEGSLQFAGITTDTLGIALTEVPVLWSLVTPSPFLTITQFGLVTVSPQATPGDYVLRATAQNLVSTATVRVLPRPPGKLIFVSAAGGKNYQVFVKDFATDADAAPITAGTGFIGGLAVDESTRTIYFARGEPPRSDIFSVSMNGGSPTNLTNDDFAGNQGPVVNPITHEIFFSRLDNDGLAQIYRMQGDGRGITQVSGGSQSKLTPAISPDGQRLAWTEFFLPSGNSEVVTASIAGLAPLRLTNRTGADGGPFWVSATRVLWTGFENGNFEIFAADVDGVASPVNLTKATASDREASKDCAPNTFLFISSRDAQLEAYQFDMTTGLAVKYQMRTPFVVTAARRLCSA